MVAGWTILGMGMNAHATSKMVFNVQTGEVVPARIATVDVIDESLGNRQNIAFNTSVVIANSIRINASATTFNWNITAPGDYMAQVSDVTIASTGDATLTRAGFGDVTNGATPITTFWTGRLLGDRPALADFVRASSLNGQAALNGSATPTTLHEWMRLDVRTLPSDGTYSNSVTFTVSPRL